MDLVWLFVWLATTLKSGFVEGIDKNEDYFTSVVGIQRLVRKEQVIMKSMVDYVEKLDRRKAVVIKYEVFNVDWLLPTHSKPRFILRYLKDYEESVVPVLQRFPFEDRIRKFTSKVSVYEWEDDLSVVTEAISAHPFLAHRLLRRFARELPEIMLDFSMEIEKGWQF